MIALIAILLSLLAIPALAQEHSHPPEHVELHQKFYSNWMRPDDPRISCCNRSDCAPAEARWINGKWMARRENDADWLTVPPDKIEHKRDSPDGRNHLCAPWGQTAIVYCFIAGAGI